MKASKGSLYLQGRIYWFAVSIDGKRERFSLTTTNLKEAEKKAIDIRKRLDLGINPVQQAKENITLTELVERYKKFSANTKAPATAARDSAALTKLSAVYGSRNIQHITPKDLDDYSTKETKLKPASLNRELTCIKAMFRKADDWGLLTQGNPTKGLKYRRTQQRPIPFLMDDDIKRIITAAENEPGNLKEVIIFLLETGCRLGEFCAVKVSDIDLKNHQVAIIASKTYSLRYARITDRLLPIMERWIKEGKPEYPQGNMYSVWIRRLGKSMNPPIKIYPHLFRHTYASRMAEKVPITVVKALLGHSDIKTTMKYAHLRPDVLSGADAGYQY